MRRLVHALFAVGLGGGLIVGLAAQPASAEARCDPKGVTHSHWHAAHGHWHNWISLGKDRNGVYAAWLEIEQRVDTARC